MCSCACASGTYSQYLQRRDFVLQHFLGFVEVRQHVLCVSAVGGGQVVQLPLVPLCQLLLVSPEVRRAASSVEDEEEATTTGGDFFLTIQRTMCRHMKEGRNPGRQFTEGHACVRQRATETLRSGRCTDL